MINSSLSCRLLRSPTSHNYDFRRVGVSVSVCETVAITLPQLPEEIWGLKSQASKEDTQVVYKVCPQPTTFPATRDSCRSDLDMFLCVTHHKHSHPLGNSCLSAVKPPQDHRTEQTLVLLQESSLHWIQFSPLSAPHLQRTTIFSVWNGWKPLPIRITLDPNSPQNKWKAEKSFRSSAEDLS